MATQAPRKSTPAVKHEAMIEEQLSKARFRVRLLDVSAAVVGCILLTLTFGLSMALADRWAGGLPVLTRQLTLVGFLLMASGYLGVFLVWPLLRSVNPYYAALKVEETLPAAKNSVVNWLDLHGQPLPPAFRTAVASRAAKDLARADIDRAFSPRRLIVLGLVTAVVFIAFALNLALGGREFLGRLANVFVPFGLIKGGVTSTNLALVEPKEGDVTVSVGRAVPFAVNVTGTIPKTNRPDSVRLLYRYSQDAPYETIPMERENPGSTLWLTQMPAFQVHSGFWYRIVGGDAATEEYRVRTRATPLIADIVATYHFRPYLAWPDFTVREPNLEAPRGTEVTLLVRTNRNVREGRLEYQNEKGSVAIKGERVGNEAPDSLRFRFTIDASGSYRIWFTSMEDESNTDPLAHKIKSFADAPPRVEVLKPQDTKLPLNGVLRIEGRADDDFGVTGMTLRIQISADNPVLTKPFREGKKDRFKLADGSYPQNLEYQDFVEIDKLRDAQGQALKPGVIEYWLEATDACDYPPPGPNVGKSQVHRVFLSKPDPKKDTPQKSEEAKKNAEKDQKDFEKKQDDKTKEDSKNAAKQKQERDEIAKNSKEEAEKGSSKDKGGDGKKDETKEKEKTPEEKAADDLARKVQDKIDQEENKGKGKGENKPDDPGEGKGEGKKGPDQEKNEGEAKPQPQNGGDNAGEGKGEGKKGPDQQKNEGEGKGAGQPPQGQENGDNKQTGEGKGEGKQPSPKNEGEGKGEGKQPNPKNEGEGKGEGKKGPDQKKNEGEARGEGKPEPGAGKDDKGAARGGPNEGGKGDQKGEAKGGPGQPTPPAEAKGGGNNEGKPGTEKSEAKGGGKGGDPNAAGQEKPAPAGKPDLVGTGKGEGKHAGGKEDPRAAASQPVKDLIDKFEKGTPKQREEAKEKLEELRRDAKADKADRDAAASALQPVDKKVGDTVQGTKERGAGKGDSAESKENMEKIEAASRQIKDLADKLQGDDKKEAKRAEEELEKLSRDARAKADRDGAAAALKEFAEQPPEGGKDPGKGKGPDGTGNTNNEKPPEGDPARKGPKGPSGTGNKSGKGPGSDPGIGGDGGTLLRPVKGPAVAGPGTQADIEHQRRAGELQLQKFKDRVTPQMLKDLGISEDEWKKFLSSRGETLKTMKPEALPTARTPGSFLPNGAPRAFENTGKSSDPLQAGSRSLPPPELLEGFKKFGDTKKP